jgi:hypothetical protein
MKFSQWLEQIKVPVDQINTKNISLPSPEQFQFSDYLLKQKFGYLINKYPDVNFDYEEQNDSLTVFGGLVQNVIFINDEKFEFPLQLVQKIVNKYFTTSQLGLIITQNNFIAHQTQPLKPTITDNETGEYILELDFPNASQIKDLDQRIGRFYKILNLVRNELDAHLAQLEQ